MVIFHSYVSLPEGKMNPPTTYFGCMPQFDVGDIQFFLLRHPPAYRSLVHKKNPIFIGSNMFKPILLTGWWLSPTPLKKI